MHYYRLMLTVLDQHQHPLGNNEYILTVIYESRHISRGDSRNVVNIVERVLTTENFPMLNSVFDNAVHLNMDDGMFATLFGTQLWQMRYVRENIETRNLNAGILSDYQTMQFIEWTNYDIDSLIVVPFGVAAPGVNANHVANILAYIGQNNLHILRTPGVFHVVMNDNQTGRPTRLFINDTFPKSIST